MIDYCLASIVFQTIPEFFPISVVNVSTRETKIVKDLDLSLSTDSEDSSTVPPSNMTVQSNDAAEQQQETPLLQWYSRTFGWLEQVPLCGATHLDSPTAPLPPSATNALDDDATDVLFLSSKPFLMMDDMTMKLNCSSTRQRTTDLPLRSLSRAAYYEKRQDSLSSCATELTAAISESSSFTSYRSWSNDMNRMSLMNGDEWDNDEDEDDEEDRDTVQNEMELFRSVAQSPFYVPSPTRQVRQPKSLLVQDSFPELSASSYRQNESFKPQSLVNYKMVRKESHGAANQFVQSQ